MAERQCVVCGKLFCAPPSSKKITCSKVCSSVRKSKSHVGVTNVWSDDARESLSKRGQTGNLKHGTAAAQASPIAGRFETNREAKIWTLVSPTGVEITVCNLLLWARGNTHLFDKPPGDKSAMQISHGFRAIARTIEGKRGGGSKHRGAMTYFGWTLKGAPKKPGAN